VVINGHNGNPLHQVIIHTKKSSSAELLEGWFVIYYCQYMNFTNDIKLNKLTFQFLTLFPPSVGCGFAAASFFDFGACGKV